MTVGTQSMVELMEITGAITNSDDATVTANAAGKIVSVSVKDGDSVTAGQVIGRQDTVDEQAMLRQQLSSVSSAMARLNEARNDAAIGPKRSASVVRASRAQLQQAEQNLLKAKNGARPEEKAQAEANVRNAKTQLDISKRALDRAESLFKEGAISQKERDNAQSLYSNALANYESALESKRIVLNATRSEDLRIAMASVTSARESLQQAIDNQKLDSQYIEKISQAEANLNQARESVNLARMAIEDSIIKSPLTGRISGKPAQPGQYLGPGTPFVRIIGRDGIYFEGDVPETKINLVKQGMQVIVSLEAVPNTKISGKVAAINPSSGSLGRLFKVRITLDSTPDTVKSGMFARGKIELSRNDNAIAVPKNVLLRDTNGEYVFVLNGDVAQRISVKTGRTQGEMVQVDGLPAGKQLVIQGQDQLKAGTKVRIESADKK